MPVEDAADLARVVDYIHLNPVRARVDSPRQLIEYRVSSLNTLLKEACPVPLCTEVWLTARGG